MFLSLFCAPGDIFGSRRRTDISSPNATYGRMLERDKPKLIGGQHGRAGFILKPQSFICRIPTSIHLYTIRALTRKQSWAELFYLWLYSHCSEWYLPICFIWLYALLSLRVTEVHIPSSSLMLLTTSPQTVLGRTFSTPKGASFQKGSFSFPSKIQASEQLDV